MSKEESLYRPVSSARVPGFVIDKIGEDSVASAQTPFKEGFVPDFSRIVTSKRKSKDTPELVQISPTQKRSFEMRYGREGFVFWADEFGNPYGVIQLKGGNVTEPDVRVEKRAPSGFVIWGIQDSDSILRTVRASNILRSHNVATESIVRLTEPSQLRFKGEPVSREEYKSRLTKKIYEANHRKNSKNHDGWRAVTRDEVPKMASELNDMTFYLTTLGRQVSERFHDLKFISTPEQLQEVMRRVFTFINTKNKWLKETGVDEGANYEYDSSNPDDVLMYFTQDLPQEVAKNYAKLHNLGLVHVFPHLGNVSLVGSIYDLDSVYGEPLGIGDEKVTAKEIEEDVKCLISGRDGWNQADGIMPLLDHLQEKDLFNAPYDISDTFARNFALQYIADRGWGEDFKQNIENIEMVMDACRIFITRKSDGDIRIALANQLGVENTNLLYRRAMMGGYPYPLMVDVNDIKFNSGSTYELVPIENNGGFLLAENSYEVEPSEDQEQQVTLGEIDEKREVEAKKLLEQLLSWHEIDTLMDKIPIMGGGTEGKKYFQFGTVMEATADFHRSLTQNDISDLIRLYVNGELDDVISNHRPRVMGSLSLTLAQINREQVARTLNAIMPDPSDPDFIKKLVRINEFAELLPARSEYQRAGDFAHYIWDSMGSKREGFDTENEVEFKSAITLFGRGIPTRKLHEMFNHQLSELIATGFTEHQLDALKEALKYPDITDKLMGEDNARYLIKLAITGVQIRNGQRENLELMPTEDADLNQRISIDLQYLLASEVMSQVTDENLIKMLEFPVDAGWYRMHLQELLRAGKSLHPDSFFAKGLGEAKLSANHAADIIKTILDMNDGDLSQADPVVMEILGQKTYGGKIKQDTASDLVMSCMAFGIDIPQIMESTFEQEENRRIFIDFLPKWHHSPDKDRSIYRGHGDFPLNPIYKFMSEGLSSLPPKVADFIEEFGNEEDVVETLGKKVLQHLFEAGYYEHYFGAMLSSQSNYPEPKISFKDILYNRSADRKGYLMWKIVHPDIWNVLSLVEPQTIADYIKEEIAEGKVHSEFRRGNVVGQRDNDLDECIRPDIYKKVAPLIGEV